MPFFSILIPTGDRPQLLKYALESLKRQVFTDFEVIISDNGLEKEGTYNEVEKLNDPRFKYVATQERLRMSDNWENALSLATGEYIYVLIDKTMLLPYALLWAHQELIKNQWDILSFWNEGFSFTDEKSGDVSGQYQPSWEFNQPQSFKPADVVQQHLSFFDNANKLGPFYFRSKICFAFFARSWMETVARGKFFDAYCPDYASMTQAALHAKKAYDLGMPLLVSINSFVSNGAKERSDPMNTVRFVNDEKSISDFPLSNIPSSVHNFVAYDMIKLLNEYKSFKLKPWQVVNLIKRAHEDLNRYDEGLIEDQRRMLHRMERDIPLIDKMMATYQSGKHRSSVFLKRLLRFAFIRLTRAFKLKNRFSDEIIHRAAFINADFRCSSPLDALEMAHRHYAQFRTLPYNKSLDQCAQ